MAAPSTIPCSVAYTTGMETHEATTADPAVDQGSLVFREATLQEKHLCWTRNSASWASPLTNLEDYIGRETCNGSQELTRDGQIRYWVLVDPTEHGHIYVAVETLQKQVLVKTRHEGCHEEIGYGIRSVFTDPNARRRGLATVAMRRLADWLDREGGARFSALYSDLGKVWYAKRGWRPYSSRQMVLSLDSEVGGQHLGAEEAATPLYLADMQRLCEVDTETLRCSMQEQDLPEGVDARFAFAPSYQHAHWHFAMAEYIAAIHLGKDRIPQVKGARAGDHWLYWTHNFRDHELLVLRVVSLDKTDQTATQAAMAALLRRAVLEAQQWGFHSVLAWEPSPDLLTAARAIHGVKQVRLEDRDEGSIPSLRWSGDGANKTVLWEANEKFCWC